ncbi:vWA-like protein [Exidia glandulosa HHB12029]|uniref:VWA-like protein n=1 Tax=Exidia glandulosa HHB12029 TaxID=1314781 RepID=A0A165KYB8_EXIGL|nr:vWA-like protein [Exidia glandulosa HHB12029]
MERCGIARLSSQSVNSNDFALVNATCHFFVVDVNVQAIVKQSYLSHCNIDNHVRYLFPLPDGASLCALEVAINGNRVEDLLGHQRNLNNSGSFGSIDVYLGVLPKGGSVDISLSFVWQVTTVIEADTLTVIVPSIVAPLYSGVTRSSVRAGANLTMSLQMTSEILSISSPTNPLQISLGSATDDRRSPADPRLARIKFAQPCLLDRDVVIEVRLRAGIGGSRCILERTLRGTIARDAYALTLEPDFSLAAVNQQRYIFLVDRSGSMSGTRIARVRSALQILLRSIPSQGSSFDLVSFGSDCDSPWFQPVEYSAETLQAASRLVEGMDADYGGTDMTGGLEYTCSRRATHCPTVVLLLTDGGANDVNGAVNAADRAVRSSGGLLRIFVLGIGAEVSRATCDGIARVGNGVASYVDSDGIDTELVTLLRSTRVYAIRNITIDWCYSEDSGTLSDYEPLSRSRAPEQRQSSSEHQSTGALDRY